MKNNKRIVICILLIVIMIGTLLIISNKPKKTFNFNGSTIALLVNGKVSNTFPSKGLYQIDITCDKIYVKNEKELNKYLNKEIYKIFSDRLMY